MMQSAIRRLTFLLGLGVAAELALAAPQLAVLQIGNGTSAVGFSAGPVSIDYFDPTALNQAAPLSQVAIPSTGANALTTDFTPIQGELGSAPNGALVFGGFHADAGTANVTQSAGFFVPRVVGTVTGSTFTLAASFGNQAPSGDYSSAELASAASDSNGHFWGASTKQGTILARGGGGNNVVVQSTRTNTRAINVVNGDLRFSAISGVKGIFSLGPASSATAATTPTRIIDTGSSSIPSDFAFNAADTIAYVADDREAGPGGFHTGAGVQRFDNIAGVWTLSYTFGIDAQAAIGATGLGVDWSGPNPIVYATTDGGSSSRILRWVDTGPASVQTTLATAGTNIGYRGVEFIPEPTSLPLIAAGLASLSQRRRAARR